MSTSAEVLCSELEFEGQLLRFEQPLLVIQELEADGTAALSSPLFELSAAGADLAEAWEMFSDLIISTYLQYHATDAVPHFPAARRQWEAARGLKARHYVLQPA